MNKLDKDYQALLQDILDNGHQKGDRTGTGTISVFGRQIRHNMKDGFPLLTTKKMYFKGIVTELLWFLRGDTNIKYLVDNDCHIWDGDAYKRYLNKNMFLPDPKWLKETEDGEYDLLDKDEFVNRIKTDDEFAEKWGELGPVYGKQWREWSNYRRVDSVDEIWSDYRKEDPIDQIQNLINDLKTNPDSRRLMVNAWNVGELDSMTLPPCHYGFQVYTRELSEKERGDLYVNKTNSNRDELMKQTYTSDEWISLFNEHNIPTRAISLSWNQRSVDTPLGLPFNIASYALLLEIIGKMVNMVPEELIGNLGDTHIYSNQVEGCIEQIGQPIFEENYIDGILNSPMNEGIKKQIMTRHTREPYPLPKLVFGKTDEFFRELGNDLSLLSHLDPSDFKMENYQSHPTIKFPLSN